MWFVVLISVIERLVIIGMMCLGNYRLIVFRFMVLIGRNCMVWFGVVSFSVCFEGCYVSVFDICGLFSL